MLHIHLPECESTQLYLKENWDEFSQKNSDILITTDKQLHGIGRSGYHWDDYPNALAFSFNIHPSVNVITLPMVIGIIICEYSLDTWNIGLKLKWPNDLINGDGQKCGGILCQYLNEHTILCGIGLNLGPASDIFKNKHYKIHPGVIDPNRVLIGEDRKNISQDIYDYIYTFDYSKLNIKDSFQHFCSHMDQVVSITNGDQIHSGKFVGITQNGEALLKCDKGPIQVFISGSLDICIY